MLVHRIVRAPEKRVYYINVGSIPPNEVDAFMEKTVSKMKKNSVIVDLAAGTGGNCELTKVGKVVQKDGVKIVGEIDILKNVKHAATKLYSENIRNLVQLLEENPEDEIFEEMSKHD